MQLLLIMYTNGDGMVEVVDQIGLPLVLSNSIAIAIFTTMIRVVMKEQEHEAAIANEAGFNDSGGRLPYLKEDSHMDVASGLATLLYDRLELAAVSVTNRQEVLAHVGLGDSHHRVGDAINTPLEKRCWKQSECK